MARYMFIHDSQAAMNLRGHRQKETRTIASDRRQKCNVTQREEANTCVLKSATKSCPRGDKLLNGLEEAKQVKPMTESELMQAAIKYCGDKLRCRICLVQKSIARIPGEAPTKVAVKCRKFAVREAEKDVHTVSEEPLGTHYRLDMALVVSKGTLALSTSPPLPEKRTPQSIVMKK